ncbi:hypothetical protein PR048_014398, partial [Dryococelus australis]
MNRDVTEQEAPILPARSERLSDQLDEGFRGFGAEHNQSTGISFQPSVAICHPKRIQKTPQYLEDY